MYDFYSHVYSITPSNTAGDFYKALYVGTAGNVKVNTLGIATDASGGATAEGCHTFYNVPAGTIIPVTTHQVRQTGTNASGILGLR